MQPLNVRCVVCYRMLSVAVVKTKIEMRAKHFHKKFAIRGVITVFFLELL